MTSDDTDLTQPPGRRGVPLLVAGAIGALETLALAVYAVSIGVFEFVGTTSGIVGATELAAPVLIVLLLVFAALLGWVTSLVWQRRAVGRTPFVLAQAFILVATWGMATDGDGWIRVLGVAGVVLAVVAAVSAFTSSAELTR